MKNLLIGAAFALTTMLAGGPALAADAPAAMGTVAAYGACAPARYNGWYVGGNVGANAYDTGRNDLDGYLIDNSGWSGRDIAVTAGVQGGYDWQNCNTVLGVVADFNWTNADTFSPNNPNGGSDGGITSGMDWFGTIRARAGLAVNDSLFYVTGGLAFADFDTRFVEGDVFRTSETRWGLVGGAGAEFALSGNWTLGTEFLYMKFAEDSVTFDNGDEFSFELDDSAWIVRALLNYRFGAPHVASDEMYGKGAAFGPCGAARFDGWYAGLNAGAAAYRAGRNDLDGFLTDNSGWTGTDIAGTIGGQIGFDRQNCNTVLGIVADLNWTNADAFTANEPSSADGGISSEMDWFGTIRGRAGLAVNDTLIYFTGGLAFAGIDTSFEDPPTLFNTSDTRWGLVAGAGAEFLRSGGWSVGTEFLYMKFAEDSFTGDDGGTLFAFDLDDEVFVSRVTVNRRFGAGAMADAGQTGPCGSPRFGGWYAGGNLGGNAYSNNRDDLDGFLTDNSGWSGRDMTLTAGVQGGYDWQTCNMVFGIAADWNWANGDTLTRDNPNAPDDNFIRSEMDWFATIRGRAGLAVNDTLVYVTGGLAVADFDTTFADPASFLRTGGTRWGLVGGAGAEFALGGNWNLGTEVLYMQFEEDVVRLNGGESSFQLNDNVLVGRVTVNYRFGGGAR